MNILMLTKFPPTQGGEAAKSFWMARALGLRGHTVHVVTNANETDPAYGADGADHPEVHLPASVHVHFIENEAEFHIPYHRAFTERLASKCLDLISMTSIDVIDACPLMPFGTAALLVRSCTGLPVVQRHGGSDIGYLWRIPNYRAVITHVLRLASRVVTSGERSVRNQFVEAGVDPARLTTFCYSLDSNVFRPEGPRHSLLSPVHAPTLLFSGKLSPAKHLLQLLGALKAVDDPFRLVFIPVGFSRRLMAELIARYELDHVTTILSPRPVWEMPSVLRSVDAVFCLEEDFGTPHHWPVFPREVLASGACLVASREQVARGIPGPSKAARHFVAVDPRDPKSIADGTHRVLTDQELREETGIAGLHLSRRIEDHASMVYGIECIYNDVLDQLHASECHPSSSWRGHLSPTTVSN